MKKNNYLIISIILLQVILTWLSLIKEGNFFSYETLIFMPLFVCSWSFILAIIALLSKKEPFSFISIFVFFVLYSLNILGLLYILASVILRGPLRESGLIFIAFPIYGFFISFGSIIVSMIAFYAKNRLQNKNKS